MSIAIITCDIDIGSAGTLTRQLFEYGEKAGKELVVYHSRGKRHKEKGVYKYEYKAEIYIHKILTLIMGNQGCHSRFATNRLIKSMIKNNTQIAIIITLHDYSVMEERLFDYFRKYSIKVVYITIDQYAALGKCCYADGCQKYKGGCGNCPQLLSYPKSLFFDKSRQLFFMKEREYNKNDIVFMGPRFNLELFRKSPLTNNRELIGINWGIDLEKYRYCYDYDISKKYGIPSEKMIILCVAPYSNESKGVKRYFFDLARRVKDERYHFVNVGYDGGKGEKNIPGNMTVIPYIKDQSELIKLYSLSDLYMLPSISDTMPLSCIIALACGIQVCCFYTSGLKYLAPRELGVVLYAETISTDALIKIISRQKKKTEETMNNCRKYAEETFSSVDFCTKVYDVINRF